MNAPMAGTSNLEPLGGQVAWVTGSSRGLGRAMAEELHRLGARVAVHGTTSDSPAKFGVAESMERLAADMSGRGGDEVTGVWGDLTVEGEVKRIAGEIRSKWGQIDILVCCAGGDIGAAGTGFEQTGKPQNDDCLGISLDDFHSVLARNLMTAVLCCREVAPEMMERKQGRIITIGSSGACVGRQTLCAYRVAKAGLHMFTSCLADQLRPYNIPVNCVAPGSVSSERWQIAYGETHRDRLYKDESLERIAEPHELAAVIGFLCTPAAQYVSGQVLRFDGGEQLFPC